MNPTLVARRVRLGPRSAGIPMTPEEFDSLDPEDFHERYRYELINGVLVVTPPAGNAEVNPNQYLGHWLLQYQETDPRGSALDTTLPEQTLSTLENRRRCDRAIWTGLGRLPDPEKDIPSIVVEFVSISRRDHRRDYEEKLREYMAIGVTEYWIIDRFRRVLTVHRQTPGGVVASTIEENKTYESGLLPGFVLPLGRLLGSADQWSRQKKSRRTPHREPPHRA